MENVKTVSSVADIPISPENADTSARQLFVWPEAMAGDKHLDRPMYATQWGTVPRAVVVGAPMLPAGTRVLTDLGLAGVVAYDGRAESVENRAMLNGRPVGLLVFEVTHYEYTVLLDCGATVLWQTVTAENVPDPDPNEPPAVYVKRDGDAHLFGALVAHWFYETRSAAACEASARRRRIASRAEYDRRDADRRRERANTIRAALAEWVQRWGEPAALRQADGKESLVREFLDLIRPSGAIAAAPASDGREYVAVARTDNSETMHGVKLTARLSRDDWKVVAAEARAVGGYWSRFAQLFVFPSETAARVFASAPAEVLA